MEQNNKNEFNLQKRTKSPLFWIGLVSAVYTAIVNAGVAANVEMPWWIGGIGVALSALLMYCNGNNPSMPNKY